VNKLNSHSLRLYFAQFLVVVDATIAVVSSWLSPPVLHPESYLGLSVISSGLPLWSSGQSSIPSATRCSEK
jgi:hypothetical protein